MDEEKDSKQKENNDQVDSSAYNDKSVENSNINDEDIQIIKSEIVEECESNKKKKYIVISFIIGVVACLIFIVCSTVSKYENLVYPGSKLYGKDISKLTSSEVLNEITDIENRIENQNIIIEANDRKYTISANEIIKDNNKEEVINEIMMSGKDGNIFKKYINIISKNGIKHRIDIEFDKNRIKEYIKTIASEANKKPVEPSITIDDSNIKYKEGKEGFSIKEGELMDNVVSLAMNIWEEQNKKLQVTFEKTKPTIAIEDLKKVDTKISEFSTYYGGGSPRGTNIEVAAQKLDNILLMPGEEFSYEKTIGPVSASNGYKEASVIVNGKLENGIGGGVCQVSSTLYNTQLKAGILPTERRNHSKAVDYVPRGLDATLASGSIDYKFKNTYDYPLVINAYTSNGKLFVEIWSNQNATKGVTYEPISYVSGKRAESYLYGYDNTGKKIYEKHIDTSIYK